MVKQLCCDRCDHINTKKKNLKRHMGDKYERVKYNCYACDITSTRQSLRWYHIKVKHDGLEELKHFCPQCDRIATHQYIKNMKKFTLNTLHKKMKKENINKLNSIIWWVTLILQEFYTRRKWRVLTLRATSSLDQFGGEAR